MAIEDKFSSEEGSQSKRGMTELSGGGKIA